MPRFQAKELLVPLAVAGLVTAAYLLSPHGAKNVPKATNAPAAAPKTGAAGPLAITLMPTVKDGPRGDARIVGAGSPFRIDVRLTAGPPAGLTAELRQGTCATAVNTGVRLATLANGVGTTTVYADLHDMQKKGGAVIVILRDKTVVACGAVPPVAAAPPSTGPGIPLPDGRRVMPDGTVEMTKPNAPR